MAEEAAACRWAEMLRADGATVWLCSQEVPPEQEPEILLTDSSRLDVARADSLGVIKMNADGPADVHLPADCTAREVRLACSLLAQVVRLRRRERAAAEVHRKLSVAALTDPLTGLPNRRAWDAALQERLAQAAASTQRLCLAILDLDEFKRVNDEHGYGAGDEVLREAARAVYDSLRRDDFVARLGGDEFGLLLWVPDDAVADRVVDRVRAALASRLTAPSTSGTTASAGYALAQCGFQPSSDFPSALFNAADAALRHAKRRGRNRTAGSEGDPG